MDRIQKILVRAGRKDLAQEYYEKVAAGQYDVVVVGGFAIGRGISSLAQAKRMAKENSVKGDLVQVLDTRSGYAIAEFQNGKIASKIAAQTNVNRKKKALEFNKKQKDAAMKMQKLIIEHFGHSRARTWSAPLLDEVKVRIYGDAAYIAANFNENHIEFDKELAKRLAKEAGLELNTKERAGWFFSSAFPEGSQVQIHFKYDTFWI